MLRTKLSYYPIVLLAGVIGVSAIDSAPAQNRPRPNGRLPEPPVLREPYRSLDARTGADGSRPGGNNQKPVASPVRDTKNQVYSSNKGGKEYVFQAPGNVRPHNAAAPARTGSPVRPSDNPRPPAGGEKLYRVLVKGDDPTTLAKIKEIEPLAFVRPGESVIQVGIFQEQRQAQGRVKELANRGFTARVVAFAPARP